MNGKALCRNVLRSKAEPNLTENMFWYIIKYKSIIAKCHEWMVKYFVKMYKGPKLYQIRLKNIFWNITK